MNKNAQVNLEVAGSTVIAVLTLVIIAIAALLVVSVMSADSVIDQSSLVATVVNESGSLTNAGYTLAGASVSGYASPTITSITNTTNGTVIAPALYTFTSATGVLRNATASSWGNVMITYTYNYNSVTANSVNNIAGNVSNGSTSFFTNVPTIFTILGVVIIIGAIGLIIYVVRRLTDRESMSYM